MTDTEIQNRDNLVAPTIAQAGVETSLGHGANYRTCFCDETQALPSIHTAHS
jgi:hypothetical protein